MKELISLVLADDHHVVRQGLKSLLEAESDLQVIGEAADGLDTVRLVEKLRPDVLVVDVMMGGINGLEVARQVSKRSPRIGIVILSMYSNEAYVLEALKAGARAYVLKESTASELVKAVRAAATGHRYLSSSLSERAIEAYIEKSRDTVIDPYDILTTREREVLQLAAQGYTNTDIATRLYISRRTVEAHRANMMQKLGLHTHSQIVSYAIQRGILPLNNEPPLHKS